MKLAGRVAHQTFFDILQHAQLFIFGSLTNILIINLLSREEYGLIGLSAGYFVIFSWFLISPEGILVQRYQQYKKDLSKYISIFYTFNFIKIIFSLCVLSIISALIYFTQGSGYFSAIFLLFSIGQILIMFLGQVQFFLKIEFQQKKVTGLTTILRTIQLLFLLFLFFQPSAVWYLSFMIFFTVFEIIIYSRALQKIYKFSWWHPLMNSYLVIKENIKEFSFWHHITNTFISYIYQIDVVFLSLWASLVVVGNYSIALKIANLSFILPSLVQASTTLALTRIKTPEKKHTITSIFIKYSALVSILQMTGFILLGKWYIQLHTQLYIDEIYTYTLLIFTGATILNVFRPLLSYIVATAQMKKFFAYSVLPSMIFATILYLILGKLYLGVGLATANIFAYSFWVTTMLIFAYKKLGLKLKIKLLELSEKELMRDFFDKYNNLYNKRKRG